MKVSYEWLQSFFDAKLPDAENLSELFTFGAFEIEDVEKAGDDTMLDVKVLPDRAPDCLCHRGIAKEVSVLAGIPMKIDSLKAPAPELVPAADILSVSSTDTKRCPYYGAALIRGVKVGPSPEWLSKRLEAVGQRSINNVVDVTNYVMLELGAPSHAFDAAKITHDGKIGIEVRAAKEGEKITTLTNDAYELNPEITVIGDALDGSALALGGIKGGKQAEVDEGTTDVVIEAALFDPVRTRKSSQTLRLRTDASQRFENGIAPQLPVYGIARVVELVQEITGGELVGYAHTGIPEHHPFILGVSAEEVNRRLGTVLSHEDIENILKKIGMEPRTIDNPLVHVAAEAPKYEGVPYKHGASVLREAPGLFDCSSFTAWLYAQAGIAIPRISVDQCVWGDTIEKSDLLPGDLVFANSGVDHIWESSKEFVPGTPVPEGVDHVGVYLGEGKIAHSTRDARGVTIQDITTAPRFGEKIVAYRRMANPGEKRLIIEVPFERLDLRQPADLIEEIGRISGYGNIEGKQLPLASGPVITNKKMAVMEKVRQALDALGFTEIYTYALRDDGDVALANALAADKGTLRKDLRGGMQEALEKNEYYLPLFGAEEVKLYELGNIFTGDGEYLHLALGARAVAGKGREERTHALLKEAQHAVEGALGTSVDGGAENGVLEIDLADAVEASSDTEYPDLPLVAPGTSYVSLSPYPFVLRDIALWVPSGTDETDVAAVLRDAGGELLLRLDPFDRFEKDGRTSYAFHLVFQSNERTLTETEVNGCMDTINKALTDRQWEIR